MNHAQIINITNYFFQPTYDGQSSNMSSVKLNISWRGKKLENSLVSLNQNQQFHNYNQTSVVCVHSFRNGMVAIEISAFVVVIIIILPNITIKIYSLHS